MSWRITADHINLGNEDSSEVGMGFGSKGVMEMPFAFRLKDDDGEVYFRGVSTDNNSEVAFEPLDWAMSAYGCTTIEYRNAGVWEVL